MGISINNHLSIRIWIKGKDQQLLSIKTKNCMGEGPDNRYSVYSAIAAIRAVKMQEIPIPRCVIII